MDENTKRPGSTDGTGSGFGSSDSSGVSGSTFDRSGDIGLTSGSEVGGFSSGTSGFGNRANEGDTASLLNENLSGDNASKLGDTKSFERVLKDLGIPDSTVEKMRESIENLDLENYFNQAKDYLKDATAKAKTIAKDNKAIVAGALAVVTIGAGVLLAISRGKDKDDRNSDRP